MKSEQNPIQIHGNCDLCGQRMAPSMTDNREHAHLCRDCALHMEAMPETLATCVARFLIGNPV